MLDDRRWKAVPAIGNFGDRASLPSALLASYPVTLTTPLHRIRHYGLFANGNRAANIARARELLGLPWAFQGDRALGKRKEGFVRITGGSGARPPVGWRDG